ncbi:Ferroporti-1 [Fimicolochytrium jonesii]|uniref:Ferroporti-1 n=1 Tax=Fimicolochytrium jonesii TaxID=1396493 RepID=UPI0022FE8C48|nr:Ferroporti-1 [Fimicolochytrium jonesii]KAI8816997.1 Ferroporti-1 [Fimicolochytrium jonesii]
MSTTSVTVADNFTPPATSQNHNLPVLTEAEGDHESPPEEENDFQLIDSFEKKTGYLLCLSYFFTTWSVRADEWATAIFLAYIFPDTLLQVSLYTLVVTASAIIFSSSIGRRVDTARRLVGIRAFLITQKLSIALTALTLYATSEYLIVRVAWTYVGFAAVCVLGCALRLANVGTTIAVERDWVVVLARGKSGVLTSLNSHLRRIDLLCKLLAPLVVSAINIKASTPTVMLVVAAMSIATIPVEWIFITAVYNRVPALAVAKSPRAAEDIHIGETSPGDTSPPTLPEATPMSPTPPPHRTRFHNFRTSMHTFTHDPTFLTSLSLAQLYFTVLSLNPVMITYLLSQSFTQPFLALIRLLAVLSGLSATFAIKPMVVHLGLVRTGLWSVWSECACVAVAVGSFGVGGERRVVSAGMLLGGTVASRFGLWGFDLAQMQILQECVPPATLGLISGHQTSLQNTFDLLASLATIVFSRPEQFYIPAIMTFVAVLSASLTFSLYARRNRGHLFHVEKWVRVGGKGGWGWGWGRQR